MCQIRPLEKKQQSDPEGPRGADEELQPKPGNVIKDIAKEDVGTKDEWVPRDPSMVRLTGRHPFNAEPTVAVLGQEYITRPEVHYVRNHGAVPKVRIDYNKE
jgi:hypothetical protein